MGSGLFAFITCLLYNMIKHKFRLSDMIPRAWLRKLKPPRSSLTTNHDHDHNHDLDQPHQRKSYHFSRQFDTVQPTHPPSPPRRSTNKHRRSTFLRRPTRRSTPRRLTAAVSSGCSCRTLTDLDRVREKPECRFPISPSSSLSSTDAVFPQSPPSFGHSSGSVPSSESFDQMVSWNTTSSSCRCRADLDGSVTLEEGFDRDPLFELELELELPAVITKPPEFNEMVMNLRRPGENKKPIAASSSMNSTSAVLVKVVEEDTRNSTVRANKEQKKPWPMGNSAGSPAGGMRLRVNSPKLATRKLNQARLQGRKSVSASASFRPGTNLGSMTRKSGVSDGFAVVKSSVDPGKDFRESMVEMIVENDIRASKDLEELLACYLMLNSDEYHDLIVGVFKQIWFDFYGARSK